MVTAAARAHLARQNAMRLRCYRCGEGKRYRVVRTRAGKEIGVCRACFYWLCAYRCATDARQLMPPPTRAAVTPIPR